jgi:DNA-binding IclR family transcriptional regulator
MMSCADDWNFSIKGLVKQLGWPERKVMRLVNELKKAGYIEQKTQFDDDYFDF